MKSSSDLKREYVKRLTQEIKDLESDLETKRAELSVLGGTVKHRGRPAKGTTKPRKKRKPMSAAVKKRMSEARKKYWADKKAKEKTTA